jgi:hypothetical protein
MKIHHHAMLCNNLYHLHLQHLADRAAYLAQRRRRLLDAHPAARAREDLEASTVSVTRSPPWPTNRSRA